MSSLFNNKQSQMSYEAFTSNIDANKTVAIFRLFDKQDKKFDYLFLHHTGKFEKINENFIKDNFINNRGVEYLNIKDNPIPNEKFLRVRIPEKIKNINNFSKFISNPAKLLNITYIDDNGDNNNNNNILLDYNIPDTIDNIIKNNNNIVSDAIKDNSLIQLVNSILDIYILLINKKGFDTDKFIKKDEGTFRDGIMNEVLESIKKISPIADEYEKLKQLQLQLQNSDSSSSDEKKKHEDMINNILKTIMEHIKSLLGNNPEVEQIIPNAPDLQDGVNNTSFLTVEETQKVFDSEVDNENKARAIIYSLENPSTTTSTPELQSTTSTTISTPELQSTTSTTTSTPRYMDMETQARNEFDKNSQKALIDYVKGTVKPNLVGMDDMVELSDISGHGEKLTQEDEFKIHNLLKETQDRQFVIHGLLQELDDKTKNNSHILKNNSAIQTKLNNKEQEIITLTAEISKLNSMLNNKDDNITTLKTLIDTKNKEIQTMLDNKDKDITQLNALISEINIYKDKISKLNANTSTLSALEAENINKLHEIDKLKIELSDNQDKLNNNIGELSKITSKLDIESAEIDKLKSEISNKDTIIQGQITAVNALLENGLDSNSKIDELKQIIESMKNKNNALNTQLNDLNKLNALIANLKIQNKNDLKELEKLKRDLDKAKKENLEYKIKNNALIMAMNETQKTSLRIFQELSRKEIETGYKSDFEIELVRTLEELKKANQAKENIENKYNTLLSTNQSDTANIKIIDDILKKLLYKIYNIYNNNFDTGKNIDVNTYNTEELLAKINEIYDKLEPSIKNNIQIKNQIQTELDSLKQTFNESAKSNNTFLNTIADTLNTYFKNNIPAVDVDVDNDNQDVFKRLGVIISKIAEYNAELGQVGAKEKHEIYNINKKIITSIKNKDIYSKITKTITNILKNNNIKPKTNDLNILLEDVSKILKSKPKVNDEYEQNNYKFLIYLKNFENILYKENNGFKDTSSDRIYLLDMYDNFKSNTNDFIYHNYDKILNKKDMEDLTDKLFTNKFNAIIIDNFKNLFINVMFNNVKKNTKLYKNIKKELNEFFSNHLTNKNDINYYSENLLDNVIFNLNNNFKTLFKNKLDINYFNTINNDNFNKLQKDIMGGEEEDDAFDGIYYKNENKNKNDTSSKLTIYFLIVINLIIFIILFVIITKLAKYLAIPKVKC